jgi:DNA-binding IclR family transcriptional regulator
MRRPSTLTDIEPHQQPDPSSNRRPKRRAATTQRRVQGIQSIELGGKILRTLARAREPLPLRDIAIETNMPKGQARRYLLSFARIDLVEQDRLTGFYQLGSLAIQLGLTAIAGLEVARCSLPILAELRRSVQETVVLAIWTENGPTVLHLEESRRPVTLNVRVGSALPLTRSAAGLVFCAFLDHDSVKSRLTQELDASNGGPSGELDRTLAEIRAHGLARVEGTLLSGVSAMGAPIFDHRGHLAAAIIVVGHSGILDTRWDGSVAVALRAAATRLSKRLGFAEGTSALVPRREATLSRLRKLKKS